MALPQYPDGYLKRSKKQHVNDPLLHYPCIYIWIVKPVHIVEAITFECVKRVLVAEISVTNPTGERGH